MTDFLMKQCHIRNYPIYMLSTPCYAASQSFARKSTEIFALPFISPQPKAGSKRARRNKARAKSLDAAAIKISVAFYKKGC